MCFLPILASYNADVSESSGTGTSVITITAVDKDLNENAQIRYSMYSSVAENEVGLYQINSLLCNHNWRIDQGYFAAQKIVLY